MKVIITGATGYIGSEVLRQCVAQPAITSIVALSRRPLDTHDPKLQTIIVKDFLNYDSTTIDQLKGAEACIWCLGVARGRFDVNCDYTLAGANAFASGVAKQLAEGKRFRFAYVSGAFIESDQTKTLWFKSEFRLRRGQCDTDLCAFEKDPSNNWETVIVKPGGVIRSGNFVANYLMPSWTIPLDQLAAVLIDSAMNGSKTQVLENSDLRVQASRLQDES